MAAVFADAQPDSSIDTFTKMAYRLEYKRRFAWIKAGRITADDFYAWSRVSREKRKECSAGKISLEEYIAWLKAS